MDLFVAVFSIILAAFLSGLITFSLTRKRAKVSAKELSALQKRYDKLLTELDNRQKEAQLEISARDKKMGYLRENLDKAESTCEEKQKALQLQITNKNEEILALSQKYQDMEAQMEDLRKQN